MEISVDKDGTMFWQGKPISEDDLNAALIQVHNNNPETQIVIKADEASQVKRLAFIMDECEKNVACRISLPCRAGEPAPGASMKRSSSPASRGAWAGRWPSGTSPAAIRWPVAAAVAQEIFDLRFDHPEPHDFAPLDVTNAVKVSIWAERGARRLGRARPTC